jgi:beta-lactam-binding protein with PASTA domain
MGITTIPEEPKPVEVPDVIGSSVLDARQKLRELGLVPIDGNTFFSPLTAIVVSQKPAPPSVVPVGKAVEIVAQDAL